MTDYSNTPLDRTIDNLTIPTYIIEVFNPIDKSYLNYLNEYYSRFFIEDRELLNGRFLYPIINTSIKYAPKALREDYLAEQKLLGDAILKSKDKNIATSMVFDLRKHKDPNLRFVFDNWIHVVKVPFSNYQEGFFIVGLMIHRSISKHNLTRNNDLSILQVHELGIKNEICEKIRKVPVKALMEQISSPMFIFNSARKILNSNKPTRAFLRSEEYDYQNISNFISDTARYVSDKTAAEYTSRLESKFDDLILGKKEKLDDSSTFDFENNHVDSAPEGKKDARLHADKIQTGKNGEFFFLAYLAWGDNETGNFPIDESIKESNNATQLCNNVDNIASNETIKIETLKPDSNKSVNRSQENVKSFEFQNDRKFLIKYYDDKDTLIEDIKGKGYWIPFFELFLRKKHVCIVHLFLIRPDLRAKINSLNVEKIKENFWNILKPIKKHIINHQLNFSIKKDNKNLEYELIYSSVESCNSTKIEIYKILDDIKFDVNEALEIHTTDKIIQAIEYVKVEKNNIKDTINVVLKKLENIEFSQDSKARNLWSEPMILSSLKELKKDHQNLHSLISVIKRDAPPKIKRYIESNDSVKNLCQTILNEFNQNGGDDEVKYRILNGECLTKLDDLLNMPGEPLHVVEIKLKDVFGKEKNHVVELIKSNRKEFILNRIVKNSKMSKAGFFYEAKKYIVLHYAGVKSQNEMFDYLKGYYNAVREFDDRYDRYPKIADDEDCLVLMKIFSGDDEKKFQSVKNAYINLLDELDFTCLIWLFK